MAKRVYDDKMKLEMPFKEALQRYAFTDPAEMHANIKRAKKAKPPGGKKQKPPGGIAGNVVDLRQRRMRKRNEGR